MQNVQIDYKTVKVIQRLSQHINLPFLALLFNLSYESVWKISKGYYDNLEKPEEKKEPKQVKNNSIPESFYMGGGDLIDYINFTNKLFENR